MRLDERFRKASNENENNDESDLSFTWCKGKKFRISEIQNWRNKRSWCNLLLAVIFMFSNFALLLSSDFLRQP